jgi:hypothetical protein
MSLERVVAAAALPVDDRPVVTHTTQALERAGALGTEIG